MVMHYSELKTVVTCKQQIAKSSLKEVNLETITDTQSWYKILATQWIQSYPCKNKNFSGDGEEFTKVFRAVGKAVSYFQTIHWNLAHLVKNYQGINAPSIRDRWYC